MQKPYFYQIDMWGNGQPLTWPEGQPASVRPIQGSTRVEVKNLSGFPVRVSLRPNLSPTPQGSPSFVPTPPPEVDAILQPGDGQVFTASPDQTYDLIQVWLDGPVPAIYAPVEVSAS